MDIGDPTNWESEGDDEFYFDARNDETFGDFGSGNQYRWEESQASIHQLRGTSSQGKEETLNEEGQGPQGAVTNSSSDDGVKDKGDAEYPHEAPSLWEDQDQLVQRMVNKVFEKEWEEEQEMLRRWKETSANNFGFQDCLVPLQVSTERAVQQQLNKQKTFADAARSGFPAPDHPVIKPKTLEEVERELLGGGGEPTPFTPAPPPLKILEQKDLERELLQGSAVSSIPEPLPPLPVASFPASGQHRHPHLLTTSDHSVFNIDPIVAAQLGQKCLYTGLHIPPPPGFAPKMVPYFRLRRGSFMTEKDKQKLRRIQTLQLQSDHPFPTDYYNLMYKVMCTPERRRQFLQKLYPKLELSGVQGKSQYVPDQFENSLGQLQAVSSLTPKRVMDFCVFAVSESCTPLVSKKRSQACQRRHLLLEIEGLYQCLLVLEECRIRGNILGATPAENEVLRRRSTEAARKVEKMLTNNDKLLKILTIPKGKMLVCRILPLISVPLRYALLHQLFQAIPVWGGNPEVEQKALPHLKYCIYQASTIQDLVITIGGSATNELTDNRKLFESLVTSKLGITLVLCLFHHAEHLLVTRCHPRVLEDVELLWTKKAMTGFYAMLLKHDKLATPMEYYPNVVPHLNRFPFHRADYHKLISILQQWRDKY